MAGNSRASLAFYSLGRFLTVGLVAGLWNRISVEGAEHVPTEGAFILAPVHRSNMDTPYAAATTRRRLRFMGKDSLWKTKPAAWLLSALGGFPVTRGTADREALQRCLEVLAGGEPLVVFPEGERKSGPVVSRCSRGPPISPPRRASRSCRSGSVARSGPWRRGRASSARARSSSS